MTLSERYAVADCPLVQMESLSFQDPKKLISKQGFITRMEASLGFVAMGAAACQDTPISME